MINQEKYQEDPLREYINPDLIEKAPEDFTSSVMTKLRIENRPMEVKERFGKRSIVPVISTMITLILILLAYIVPAGNNDFDNLPGLNLIQNITLPDFSIIFDTIFSFSLPVWFPYLLISILILTFFDRALSGLFHRDKNRYSENSKG